jgi:membrane protein
MTRKTRSALNYLYHKYIIIPLKIGRMAAIDTVRQDGVEHSGYLAFLLLLSLFPFLIFIFSIIGIFGDTEIGVQIIHSIISSVPAEVGEGLMPYINEIISGPPQSLLTVAIIGVIWTASSSVEGCRTILNRAYRIEFPPPYLLRRLFAIIEFFIITFVIIVGVIIFVILPNLLEKSNFDILVKLHFDYDSYYLRQIVFLLLITSATSLLYYALPNAKQKFTQTVPGSVVAVVFWILIQYAFAFYFKNFHQVTFVYGSLAGIIITLLFFYFVSIIFIFGAEFNYHFRRTYKVFLKGKK